VPNTQILSIKRFFFVFLRIKPTKNAEITPQNIQSAPISAIPPAPIPSGGMFPYKNPILVPKQTKTPFVSIITKSMLTKLLSFSACFDYKTNFFSTGSFVATLEGGFSGLSLMTSINGIEIKDIRMFIPKISVLSVEKTLSGSFGVSPANAKPVHMNATKLPAGIPMAQEAITISLSVSAHHLFAINVMAVVKIGKAQEIKELPSRIGQKVLSM